VVAAAAVAVIATRIDDNKMKLAPSQAQDEFLRRFGFGRPPFLNSYLAYVLMGQRNLPILTKKPIYNKIEFVTFGDKQKMIPALD